MDLYKIEFSEEKPQNFNEISFVFKDDISLMIEKIIENNKIKKEVTRLSYNYLNKNLEIFKKYLNIDLDFLYSKINEINDNTDILSIDYNKIKEFFGKNAKGYVSEVNKAITPELKRIEKDKEKIKQLGVNYNEEEEKKDLLTDFGLVYENEEEKNNKNKGLLKIVFLNTVFFSSDKIKTISSTNLEKAIGAILENHEKHIKEFIEYQKWEVSYHFNINDVKINSLNDLFYYGGKYEINNIDKIDTYKLNTKINGILTILQCFYILEKAIDNESDMETILSALLLIDNITINNISVQNESIKDHIGKYNLSDNEINALKESYLFKEKILKDNKNKEKIYSIVLLKQKLFLDKNSIPYQELFNYILKQDEGKLCKIEIFLNKYFKKDYDEVNLIFIFENDLEELELITKQNNIENIYKLQELHNMGIKVKKLTFTKNFIYICELLITKEINLELFYELMDENFYNKYLDFRNKKESLEKYLIYFKEASFEYIELTKSKLQTFEEYKDNNYEFNIDFKNIEEKTKKIDNILGENNILDYIEDYNLLLKKIEKIKSKSKDKKIQKKEKDEKNNFIKEFFKKYSEGEIKLISKVLKIVKISSNNTFETFKENINIIIKYKTLAEETIDLDDQDFNPTFLKDISEYLNIENQETFYKNEFTRLEIDEDLIKGTLDKYKSDNSLKLILSIGYKLNLNDLNDLFILLEEKVSDNKLNIIINTLSLLNIFNIDYDKKIEVIENIINKKEFNYLEEKEKLDFLRKETSNYKIDNGNSNIKYLVLSYLEGKINKVNFLEGLSEFKEKAIDLNSSFDKKVFKSIEDKDSNEIEHLAENIESFFDDFFEKFHSSKTSSTVNIGFGKGSGSYTRILNTILKTLKQGDNEKNIDYLNRIKTINFNNFYSNDIDITNNRINNIIGKATNIELPFYEALEKFGENVIGNISTHGKEDLAKLKTYYSEIFNKYKLILI